ncbi:MAG: hypothetical protein RIQ81_1910 [Pseudomonadota bacterium]
MPFYRSQPLLKAIMGSLLLTCLASCKCDSNSFSGKSPIRKRGSGLDGSIPISRPLNTETIHKIWIAALQGDSTVHVSRLTVEGDTVKATKKWTNLRGSGGTRTYVTEGGFVATRFPYLYFIDPEKTPEGPIQFSHELKAGSGDRRVCVASYKKNSKRFLIAAWGDGYYKEFPMADTAPFQPDWANPSASGKINLPEGWGYSCFIDQTRLVFYSQWVSSSKVGALALDPVGEVRPVDAAPNGSFTSATPKLVALTKGPKNGAGPAYSMSGDGNGNVLNGASYTYAHDKISDTVWVSASSSGNMLVAPAKCFSTEPNCTGFKEYPSKAGPLSALKDGRIVGLVRTAATGTGNGDVYIYSLKDPSDLTAGINAVRIAEVKGDPYMYTDFTGATLYVTNAEQTIPLSETVNFNKDKAVKNLQFSWVEKPGTDTQWQSMKLEMRCYSTSGTKPEYTEIAGVGASKTPIPIRIDQCSNKKFDLVDIKVTQLDDKDTMTGVDKVELAAEQ